MNLNHRPSDYESPALTAELRGLNWAKYGRIRTYDTSDYGSDALPTELRTSEAGFDPRRFKLSDTH